MGHRLRGIAVQGAMGASRKCHRVRAYGKVGGDSLIGVHRDGRGVVGTAQVTGPLDESPAC